MTSKEPNFMAPVIHLIDDHGKTRQSIRKILEKDGIKIQEAENGMEALKLLSSSPPDLILMASIMPVMDGLEACTKVKQSLAGKQIPILMFTELNEDEEVDKAFRAGASDFISKPVNPEELRHRVSRLLYLRELETQRQAAEIELKQSNRKIKTLTRKVLNAYEEERMRLARELHDELGMTLTTLKLKLQMLGKKFSHQGDDFQDELASAIDLVNDSLSVTRNTATLMRSPSLNDLGLITVVEDMTRELGINTEMKTEFTSTGKYSDLPIEVETTIYRCIQESITNVTRHSFAKNVFVKLDFNPQEVLAIIKDDGIGFDINAKTQGTKHLGLVGMKERVELLSGEMEIHSAIGMGTEIQISIPLGE